MAYVKKTWKDYPDTTTQIKAEDLNNIENGIETLAEDLNNIENGIETLDTRLNDEEMYVQATAGANGDFFVNLTNQTLVNGRIVKISFPSATNSSANARLSIDGGATYKNVRSFNNISLDAIAIQNKAIELYYDGTNLRETTLKRDMITIRVGSDYDMEANDTYEMPPYVLYNQVGNRLTLSANGVIVGSGVSKVKISAQAYWVRVGGSSGNRFLSFYTEGEVTVLRSAYFTSGERNNLYWTDFIQTVAKGDELTFRVYGKIGDRISSTGTLFTIEVVE